MTLKRTLIFTILVMIAGVGPARAQAPAVSAKQFPAGFFYQYHQAPVKEKEQALARLEATLKKLNREKLGLIAKGTVIEKLGPETKTYDRLTILDGSGLLIIARRGPNLYYGYAGPAPINPNLYIIIKNPKVNFQESYIRYGFVVEGDFVAYAHKFVTALLEELEAAASREMEPPEKRPAK
jgi:hypothetical protein